jgi:hypothetical protein
MQDRVSARFRLTQQSLSWRGLCREGGTEADANKGTTVAIMHVIDLLPA